MQQADCAPYRFGATSLGGGRTVWATSGQENEVVVIDAATYRVRGRVPVGKEPAHVVLTSDGRLAFVSNEGGDDVSVIDVRAMKVIATIPAGAGPHGLPAASQSPGLDVTKRDATPRA